MEGVAQSMRSMGVRLRGVAGVVCLLLAMAACSAQPGGTPMSSPTAWDPMAWRPSSRVAVPAMSESEMAKQRLADLESWAETLQIKPKRTPALERWTYPDEQAVPVSACIRDAGWEASVTPGGSLEVTAEEAQKAASKLAQYDCLARFSVDPRFLRPNEEMYAAVWSYFKDYGIPCLASFGIAPDGPLPTRETFIATKGRYSIYPLNANVPDDVVRVCPQLPPTRAMFGLQ